jgi:hypothetical protein
MRPAPFGAAACISNRPAQIFGHFSPGVPDSLHIAAYPCSSKETVQNQRLLEALEIRLFLAFTYCTTDRTQEVGGSNPPSSTLEGPCTRDARPTTSHLAGRHFLTFRRHWCLRLTSFAGTAVIASLCARSPRGQVRPDVGHVPLVRALRTRADHRHRRCGRGL